MSDADKAPGDPIDEEPRPVDDVVGQANEGLASAEAAQRDVSGIDVEDEDARFALYAQHAADDEPGEILVAEETVEAATDADGDTILLESVETVAVERDASASVPDQPTLVQPTVTPDDAATQAYVPPTASAAPTVVAPTVIDEESRQPIFVQAPEEPRSRGNRGAAGLIGVLAALSFAVLYLAVFLIIELLSGATPADEIGAVAMGALVSWWLWAPTVVFFLGFWLLGAIINRGRWAHWVVWGLLVGAIGYGGHLVGVMFEAQIWELTRTEGAALVESELLTPMAFAAFIIARELTIWFGAWVASRGRRVHELNVEARREYERIIEAGPTLAR